MKPFSFVFAGGSGFSLKVLELLQQSSFKLKGVVTTPPALKGRGMKKQHTPAGLLARQKKIPLQEPKNLLAQDFLKTLKGWEAQFLFVCSYGKILPQEVLDLFPHKAFNLHLSLLPLLRGPAPVQRALMSGCKQTGISLQLISKQLDTGDIVGYRTFALTQNDNSEDVYQKALQYSPTLFQLELRDFLIGQLKPQPQDHSKKTYAKKIQKKETQIVWSHPAQTIHNQIRGLFSGPQAFSFLKGQRIKIFRSQVIAEEGFWPKLSPGELFVKKNQLFVGCGTGWLELLELQKEGKKRLKAQDFLKGQSFPLGIKLEE